MAFYDSEAHICNESKTISIMKIEITEHGYSFSREWKEDELDTERPNVEEAVEAALYLLSRMYPEEKVEKAARKWEA